MGIGMFAFRIVHKLETAPAAAGDHETPLVPQQICLEPDRFSPTQCDVDCCQPATARKENRRYRSAGSVRYRQPDWSVGRNTRSGSRNSAHRTAFLEHGFGR
jgi:hypothetical protein